MTHVLITVDHIGAPFFRVLVDALCQMTSSLSSRVQSANKSPRVFNLFLFSSTTDQSTSIQLPIPSTCIRGGPQASTPFIMAKPQPHLLTIPRELRDEIYSYLSYEAKHTNQDESKTCEMHLAIHQVPYRHVLLVHSMLYREYRESTIFTQGSATFVSNLACREEKVSRNYKLAVGYEAAYVRHLIVVLQPAPVHEDWEWQGGSESYVRWENVSRLVNQLASLMHHLSTVQLATQDWIERVDEDCLSDGLRYCRRLPNGSGMFLPPPSSLAQLSLIHKGEGFHVDFGLSIAEGATACHSEAPWALEYISVHEVPIHLTKTTGFYLYAANDTNTKEYIWDSTKVLEVLKPRPYTAEILNAFVPEQAAEIERRPYTLVDWVESSGTDLGA